MTEEEQLEILREAIASLGKLYQSLARVPALAFARESEVKKSNHFTTTIPRSRARSPGS